MSPFFIVQFGVTSQLLIVPLPVALLKLTSMHEFVPPDCDGGIDAPLHCVHVEAPSGWLLLNWNHPPVVYIVGTSSNPSACLVPSGGVGVGLGVGVGVGLGPGPPSTPGLMPNQNAPSAWPLVSVPTYVVSRKLVTTSV